MALLDNLLTVQWVPEYRRILQLMYQPKSVGKMADFAFLSLYIKSNVYIFCKDLVTGCCLQGWFQTVIHFQIYFIDVTCNLCILLALFPPNNYSVC